MHATPFLPGLSPVGAKSLTATFDAGRLSSDGGLIVLREIACAPLQEPQSRRCALPGPSCRVPVRGLGPSVAGPFILGRADAGPLYFERAYGGTVAMLLARVAIAILLLLLQSASLATENDVLAKKSGEGRRVGS
jgi:hypothetical protein